MRKLLRRLNEKRRQLKPRLPVLGSAARLAAALLLLPTIAACSHTNKFQAVNRTLPEVRSVIPDTTPRPQRIPGEDLGRSRARFADYGDQNAAKLNQARQNYAAVVQRYAGPPPRRSPFGRKPAP